MNGAVTFDMAFLVEPGFLKLAIHIGGENKVAVFASGSGFKEAVEAVVWVGVSIKVQSVTVEGPGEMRGGSEPGWISHFFE